MMGTNKMSCEVACGPGDFRKGGKCDLHGCFPNGERCVNCDSLLESAERDLIDTHADKQPKPKPGDFTICFACGQPYAYIENLADPENLIRRPITKNEFRAMPLITQRVIRDAWDFRKSIIAHIAQQMKGAGDI